MQRLAPLGPVYQAGTLSGNPVAVAAGLTTLRHCTPDVYDRLNSAAQTIGALVGDAFTAAGVAHRVQFAGNLFSIFFTEDEVVDFAGAQAAQGPNSARYAAFFHSMLDSGVYLPPSAYEAWFVTACHDDDVIARIADALPAAARAAAAANDSESALESAASESAALESAASESAALESAALDSGKAAAVSAPLEP